MRMACLTEYIDQDVRRRQCRPCTNRAICKFIPGDYSDSWAKHLQVLLSQSGFLRVLLIRIAIDGYPNAIRYKNVFRTERTKAGEVS